MERVYMIADLHLAEEYPRKHTSFLSFCKLIAQEEAQLYILGDLFDAWLGDDMMSDKDLQIADAILSIKKNGGQVFFQAGNRDFLLGDKFFDISGCIPMKEEELLQINNKRVFVAHGDSLCIADKKFCEVRKRTRTKEWTNEFTGKSQEERIILKQQFFAASNQHQGDNDEGTLSIPRSYIAELLIKNDADILVHGHLHKPGRFELDLEGKKRQLICLGDWGNQGKAWLATINGRAELRSHPMDDMDNLHKVG